MTAKKSKKTEGTVDLEAVSNALGLSSRSNKWNNIKKAMPRLTPENELETIVNDKKYQLPDSVATGLDTQEVMEEYNGDYEDEDCDEIPMPPSQPPSVADLMKSKKITQGTLFEVKEPSLGESLDSAAAAYMKKNRIGKLNLKTREGEKFVVADEGEMVMPSNENDVDMIRQSLVIERVPERMRIIAVVVDKENHSSNDINLIKCNGDPLGCHAYDAQPDGYYVQCAAYTDLGAIPVAYRIRGQGSSDNNNIIALPDEMIEKYLSPTQKKTLKFFREKYSAPRFGVEYMQAITC
jgi:hypothetical protein